MLIFPPLNNYKRFLIHKACEKFASLGTFSVGQGIQRRVVIYSQLHLKYEAPEQESATTSPEPRGSEGENFR